MRKCSGYLQEAPANNLNTFSSVKERKGPGNTWEMQMDMKVVGLIELT